MKCRPSEAKPQNMDWHTPLWVSWGAFTFSSPSLLFISHQCRAFVLFFQHRQSTESCLYRAAWHPAKAVAQQERMGLIGHVQVSNTALGQVPKSLACAIHSTHITLPSLNFSDRKQHLQTSIPAGTHCNRSCTTPCYIAVPMKKELLSVMPISS